MVRTERRSGRQVTISTWKALFLRNAVARLAESRFAWFWLLFEPIAYIIVLVLILTYLRVRHIGGISTPVWVTAGVLSFLIFRRAATEGMLAVGRSKALLSYPQIKPADPVIVNAALEGLIMVILSVLLIGGASFFGMDVWPHNPLNVLEAAGGLWLIGLGYGMVNSVMLKILPPLGSVLAFMLQRPLFFLSGVLFPITVIPYPYRDWLLLNPLVHGIEAARVGFAPFYHVPPQINVVYPYLWALALIFLGLALHVRYGRRLAERK